MIVDERSLGLHNLTVRLDFDIESGCTVTVLHDETELWSKQTRHTDLALEMYNHPFAYGFRLPEGVRA
jgi:hypothetical protein